jgi:hypothetical protein
MMRLLYRSLLRLHPAAFRERYASEMLWLFDEGAGSLGAPTFLADGVVSLARQWLVRSNAWTMAAGGLGAFVLIGGMLGMASFPLRHVYGPVFEEVDFAAHSVSGPPAQFDGHWSGYFLFPGPAGQMGFTLSRMNGLWSGDLEVRGADGVLHRGVAEDIHVGADSLSFSFKTNRGEMIYRGQMVQGKLRGYVRAADATDQ